MHLCYRRRESLRTNRVGSDVRPFDRQLVRVRFTKRPAVRLRRRGRALPCSYALTGTCIYAFGGEGPSNAILATTQIYSLRVEAAATFTQAGAAVGTVQEQEPSANEIQLSWAAGSCQSGVQLPVISAAWTLGGQSIGVPAYAPCGADGPQMSWTATGGIASATWTKAGATVSQLQMPPMSGPLPEDLHLFLSPGMAFGGAAWLNNGSAPQAITTPSGADGAVLTG